MCIILDKIWYKDNSGWLATYSINWGGYCFLPTVHCISNKNNKYSYIKKLYFHNDNLETSPKNVLLDINLGLIQ